MSFSCLLWCIVVLKRSAGGIPEIEASLLADTKATTVVIDDNDFNIGLGTTDTPSPFQPLIGVYV
ncbi:MAG: hypothetical protein CMP31_00005, partial [Roseibacillus sp.]|nr:hypothetical protein [Roseibacillus sp.]